MTLSRDWPLGTCQCDCIYCKRRFKGTSHRKKICQACNQDRLINLRLTYYIILERGAVERMVVGPYKTSGQAHTDAKFWGARHGWVAHVRPLMKSIKDISPKGSPDALPARTEQFKDLRQLPEHAD